MPKIKLTKWDRQQLFTLLSAQNIARAPLGKVADMLQARDKIDPSELQSEDETKEYELSFSEAQFDQIYTLATNENVPWPINEQSAELYNRLKEAKNKDNK